MNLKRRSEVKEPGVLESEDSGLSTHIGEGDGDYVLGEEVEHEEDDTISAGRGWE